MPKTETPTDDDIVSEAKKRFERAKSAYGSSRTLAVEDTKFAMGDSDNGWQWPDDISNQRIRDQRVCLTVNLTAQHCNQIINNIRQNRPAVKVSPADDGADKETALILGGLIRNIQASSASDDAHDTAAEHAIYGGEGYWRILTEYETVDSFNQCIKIQTCPNPQLVYIDPDCKELDKSDAEWGFVFEDITKEQCKRDHPDIDPASWGEQVVKTGWANDDTVRRADYYYVTFTKDTACLLADGSTVLKSALPDGAVVVKERPTEVKKWTWCKLLGGHDKPIDTTQWLGAYLPIVAVVGKEINVNGEIVRKGIVRDLKDPARMVNFSYSETVQTLALQNKIPYMAAAESIEGYEEIWQGANLENRAYLPFNAYDDDGNSLPMPARQAPAVMPAAQVQLLQLSTEQMRAASGQQNANFGIKSEAASGVGIQRLKQQGEVATFHFPDNLARALRYEAKVLIDLIQQYYDTKRVVRILGLDGKEESAVLDPQQQQAYMEQMADTEEDIQKIFNPNVGRYDVTIDTGPAYQTQRQEAFAALSEIAARNPALMQVAGDLIMRSADFPMADQLADRLAKTLPPGLADDKGGADPQAQLQQAQAQIGQMNDQMQQMDQALQQAQGELQQAKMGVEAKIEAANIDAQVKAHQAEIDAEAARVQAGIDAQIALEKAQIDAETKKSTAALDAETKKDIAAMQIQADADIEEMRGYFDLQKAAANPPPEPKEVEAPAPTRKVMQITAPSGQVYTGTIEDEVMQ